MLLLLLAAPPVQMAFKCSCFLNVFQSLARCCATTLAHYMIWFQRCHTIHVHRGLCSRAGPHALNYRRYFFYYLWASAKSVQMAILDTSAVLDGWTDGRWVAGRRSTLLRYWLMVAINYLITYLLPLVTDMDGHLRFLPGGCVSLCLSICLLGQITGDRLNCKGRCLTVSQCGYILKYVD